MWQRLGFLVIATVAVGALPAYLLVSVFIKGFSSITSTTFWTEQESLYAALWSWDCLDGPRHRCCCDRLRQEPG